MESRSNGRVHGDSPSFRHASDVESLELALVENVVRQQLNPVDEAYALKVLLEDLGVTQDNLAARSAGAARR